jgi:hypothetical protein
MTLRERGSGVKRARDPSNIRGGKALAPAVDVDFSPALRAAVRRTGARGRTEDAQELAVLADGVGGNFHYCGLSGALRSLNLSLHATQQRMLEPKSCCRAARSTSMGEVGTDPLLFGCVAARCNERPAGPPCGQPGGDSFGGPATAQEVRGRPTRRLRRDDRLRHADRGRLVVRDEVDQRAIDLLRVGPADVVRAVFDLDKAQVGDVFMGNRLSEQAWDQQFSVAIQSSAIATLRCVDTWLTDFRGDLPKFDVLALLKSSKNCL